MGTKAAQFGRVGATSLIRHKNIYATLAQRHSLPMNHMPLSSIFSHDAPRHLHGEICEGHPIRVQVLCLLVGGGMALSGQISPEQLTTFVLYVEFVTAASLSVCDQWGGIMESIGASERVMDYLDRGVAPQLSSGRTVPNFSGRVSCFPFLLDCSCCDLVQYRSEATLRDSQPLVSVL